MADHHVHLGDNLGFLKKLPAGCVNLIYIDPPFNTGRAQSRTQIRSIRDAEGDRVGFKGHTYRTVKIGTRAYSDSFDDYLAFLEPRLVEAKRVLAENGSFFLHIDYREVHYCKVLLDCIFGRDAFINEIIWAYDYGARSKSKWPAKHDNILWYAKDPAAFTFDLEACDRIAYMAPGLVGADKAERGKTPTDVWWHTIVSPTGKEKTGYPTQKPLGILRRLLKVHSKPGDVVLDFFCGSGSTGVAAAELGRRFILCDQNPEAIAVTKMRVAQWDTQFHECDHIVAVERNGYAPAPDISDPLPRNPTRKPAAPAPTDVMPDAGTPTYPDQSPSAFHALLTSAMTERSLTIAGLTRLTGLGYPTVHKIVGGALPQRASTIAAFAVLLGIEADALIRLVQEPADRSAVSSPRTSGESHSPQATPSAGMPGLVLERGNHALGSFPASGDAMRSKDLARHLQQ